MTLSGGLSGHTKGTGCTVNDLFGSSVLDSSSCDFVVWA